jgi:hypothetical protein
LLKTLPLVLAAGMLFLHACSDDMPTPPKTLCDTCDTYAPVSSYDSLWGLWPYPLLRVSNTTLIPGTSILAGEVHFIGWRDISWYSGFFYDTSTRRFTYIRGGDFDFSRDGSKFLMMGEGGIHLVDRLTMTSHLLLKGSDYVLPRWSVDEQWVYLTTDGSTFRMRPDGNSLMLIVERFQRAWPLDDERLISFAPENSGVVIYNMTTKERTPLVFSGLPAGLRYNDSRPRDLSPDRTKILADISTGEGILERERRGLYLFDLTTMSARQVLRGQYWGYEYYPKWTSNTTFMASYHCRKDTAAMIYEYDLCGRVIRQVTYKEMKFYPF